MKGVVIDFSIQANSGLISGDDGNRYTFVGAEWRENSPPVRGMRVDFDTESDGIASAVYQEIIVKPQKTERPTFQKNIQNQTPKAKILYQDDVDESDYTFIDWYKKVVFENYINFEGRARRSEYWWFILVNFGILLIVAFLDSIIMAMDAPFIIFTPIYLLATFLPHLGVCVRRLHDTNRSGWLLLIGVVQSSNTNPKMMLMKAIILL